MAMFNSELLAIPRRYMQLYILRYFTYYTYYIIYIYIHVYIYIYNYIYSILAYTYIVETHPYDYCVGWYWLIRIVEPPKAHWLQRGSCHLRPLALGAPIYFRGI